jgi:hypothetical protein
MGWICAGSICVGREAWICGIGAAEEVAALPIFGGGVISIPPELEEELLDPLTELTGAGALFEDVQPASQNETSDNAAIRLTVNLGLPALIFFPCKIG